MVVSAVGRPPFQRWGHSAGAAVAIAKVVKIYEIDKKNIQNVALRRFVVADSLFLTVFFLLIEMRWWR